VTPTEELRTAAEKLRSLATAASTDSDGLSTANWHYQDRGHNHGHLYGDHLTRDDGRRISWPHLLRGGSAQRPVYMHVQHAAYAAAMGPAAGLALADLLDDQADGDDDGEINPWALAVARAINGTA
jgi:hypothetical protein